MVIHLVIIYQNFLTATKTSLSQIFKNRGRHKNNNNKSCINQETHRITLKNICHRSSLDRHGFITDLKAIKLEFGCCEKNLFIPIRRPIVNECAVLVANKYFSKAVVIFFSF